MFLSAAELRVGLLNEDNRGHSDELVMTHLIKLHQVDCIQIITKDGVVVVKTLSQMGVNDESAVVMAEVSGTHNLNLDHLETLLQSCSAHVNFVICVLNVQDDELTKSVSAG